MPLATARWLPPSTDDGKQMCVPMSLQEKDALLPLSPLVLQSLPRPRFILKKAETSR